MANCSIFSLSNKKYIYKYTNYVVDDFIFKVVTFQKAFGHFTMCKGLKQFPLDTLTNVYDAVTEIVIFQFLITMKNFYHNQV